MTFFSTGGERNERVSNDKTLVGDKPDQGEPPRRPKAFYSQILPTTGKLTFKKGLAATFIDCLNLPFNQLGLQKLHVGTTLLNRSILEKSKLKWYMCYKVWQCYRGNKLLKNCNQTQLGDHHLGNLQYFWNFNSLKDPHKPHHTLWA